ncbi:MAG TPA: hypothetical protein VNS32_04765 [Flavisolibacter sp.]|nr:hypothetical protein [Flavisolibacter sp.]
MAKAVSKGEKIKGGGKKGGARFPNYSLKQVLPNLKELVSKTHGGKTIAIQQLNAGVFKLKPNSSDGKIKFSSLKQYGLADGDYSSIVSKDLASKIEFATGEEKNSLICEAFFNVPLFKNTFDTFHGDTTPKPKIKAYCVSTLNVHPDSSDKFLESLVESAEVAKLCTITGEDITFINAKDVEAKTSKSEVNIGDEDPDEDFDEAEDSGTDIDEEDDEEIPQGEPKPNGSFKKNRAVRDLSNINIQIDSHTDHEKLAKQLKVLRQYGLL